MHTMLRTLSLLALALCFAACQSARGNIDTTAIGQTFYTNVGMHFDAKRDRYLMYSTNYVGIPHYLPPGTELTLASINHKQIVLQDAEGTEYVIAYVAKHSRMPIEQWKDRQLAKTPVQLPATLTDEEKAAIAAGECRVGMSRAAVFLAWGYPPQSTNATLDGEMLEYEWRRPFIKRRVRFGADDRVESVGGR